jgi:hypothetical protein
MSGESPPQISADSEGRSSSTKDRNDFLVSLLKETRYTMFDFMFKQAAVLTLFSGWLISSEQAQQFISHHPAIRTRGAIGIALYALLFVYWIWTYRRRSKSAYGRLVELRFMPADFYSPLLISTPFALSLICAETLLCAMLSVLLFTIKQ